jgi:hypothetical protein
MSVDPGLIAALLELRLEIEQLLDTYDFWEEWFDGGEWEWEEWYE